MLHGARVAHEPQEHLLPQRPCRQRAALVAEQVLPEVEQTLAAVHGVDFGRSRQSAPRALVDALAGVHFVAGRRVDAVRRRPRLAPVGKVRACTQLRGRQDTYTFAIRPWLTLSPSMATAPSRAAWPSRAPRAAEATCSGTTPRTNKNPSCSSSCRRPAQSPAATSSLLPSPLRGSRGPRLASYLSAMSAACCPTSRNEFPTWILRARRRAVMLAELFLSSCADGTSSQVAANNKTTPNQLSFVVEARLFDRRSVQCMWSCGGAFTFNFKTMHMQNIV